MDHDNRVPHITASWYCYNGRWLNDRMQLNLSSSCSRNRIGGFDTDRAKNNRQYIITKLNRFRSGIGEWPSSKRRTQLYPLRWVKAICVNNPLNFIATVWSTHDIYTPININFNFKYSNSLLFRFTPFWFGNRLLLLYTECIVVAHFRTLRFHNPRLHNAKKRERIQSEASSLGGPVPFEGWRLIQLCCSFRPLVSGAVWGRVYGGSEREQVIIEYLSLEPHYCRASSGSGMENVVNQETMCLYGERLRWGWCESTVGFLVT